MNMEMTPARLGAMGVRLVLEFDRDGNEPSVTDAALGNDPLSEVADVTHGPLQYRDFHAAVVVEMHMH